MLAQALLERHEAYVTESEQQKAKMGETIAQLEMEKRTMKEVNAKTWEENQDLQLQLEELNRAVAGSDVHLKSLDTTLRSTREELDRVSVLASRTVQLEAQLHAMEREYAQLQQTLVSVQGQERTAVQRWRSAERTLQALQDEVERIEKTAMEERERHGETVARLQQQQALETKSKTPGRLRKQGSRRDMDGPPPRGTVVSHFVTDILQDNSDLQSSMLELREMLLASHEETERLREELLLLQPALPENRSNPLASSVARELGLESSAAGAPALHIHHHYHDAQQTKDRFPSRRTRKIRGDDASELSSTTVRLHPDRTRPCGRRPHHFPPASGTIRSQTSATLPSVILTSHRHPQALVVNTPSSRRPSPSIDQTVSDSAIGSSRPTSPEAGSPATLTPAVNWSRDRGDASLGSSTTAPKSVPWSVGGKSASSIVCPTAKDAHVKDAMAHLDLAANQTDANRPSAAPELGAMHKSSIAATGNGYSLRRSSSKESLLSISGMDIHTLRERPLQLIVTGNGLLPRLTSPASSASPALVSDQPVMGMVTATGNTAGRFTADKSAYQRTLVHARAGISTGREGTSSLYSHNKDTLGRKLGDWVWGKWVSGSATSTENLRTTAAQSASPVFHPATQPRGFPKEPGWTRAGTAKVLATDVDQALLRESLVERGA